MKAIIFSVGPIPLYNIAFYHYSGYMPNLNYYNKSYTIYEYFIFQKTVGKQQLNENNVIKYVQYRR